MQSSDRKMLSKQRGFEMSNQRVTALNGEMQSSDRET